MPGHSGLGPAHQHHPQMSRWAAHPDVAVLPRPLKFAEQFERIGKSEKLAQRRKQRRKHGPRRFTRSQIAAVFSHLQQQCADPHRRRYAIVLRAMFLLGLNGGYSNIDIASLTSSMIDWEKRLVEYDRIKTGIIRVVLP